MQDQSPKPNGRVASQSKSYWYDIIKQWQASNESQKSFCINRGIKLGTFSYWRTEFLAETNPKVENKFIPLKLKPKEFSCENIQTLIVENKNGNKVHLPLTLTSSELKELFTLLGFCHA